MVEDKYNNKKKTIIGIIIAGVFLIVLVTGATYAFFSINVSNGSTSTNINVNMGKLNNIAIKGTENNTLHIKVSSEDMKLASKGTSYYATTDTSKNYLNEGDDHVINIANLLVEGEMTPTNICTAKLKVEMDGELKDALQDGDTLLHIEGGRSKHDIDLSLLLDEYPIEFVVDKSESKPINASLKLINRDADQTYIAGKTLSVTLTIEGLTCKVQNPDDAVEKILANSEQYLEKAEEVSLRGDVLRRFQGQVEKDEQGNIINDINNYICFETTEKEKCLKDTDKYLYRIIGIDTLNNELKIIKREALNDLQQWGTPYQTWETSDLQKKLNDTLYLSEVSKSWADLIQLYDWEYGDIPYGDNLGTGIFDANNNINGQQMYKNEQAIWKTNNKVSAKIGLIYLSDYWLSGGDNLKCVNSNLCIECKKSWMYLSNNDTKDLSTTKQDPPSFREWTASTQDSYWSAWDIYTIGSPAGCGRVDCFDSVRPVFYLQSGLKLLGEGKLSDPYIIQGVE